MAARKQEANGQSSTLGRSFDPTPGQHEGGGKEGTGQPVANKDVDVDDVAVASAIEATTEVETIMTSEAPPSASTRATPKRGGSKSLPCRGRRCQRLDMVRPRREWTSSLVDAARRRQQRHLLSLMPRSSPLKPPNYGLNL